MLDHYVRAGVTGWVPSETLPWEGAEPEFTLAITVAEPASVPDADVPGVTIRSLETGEWPGWDTSAVSAIWVTAMTRRLAGMGGSPARPAGALSAGSDEGTANVHHLVAELDGDAVGLGTLHVHKQVGLLRAGMVVAHARGRGIQRALIARRVRLAEDARLRPGHGGGAARLGVSERNLVAMGLERIWSRPVYRFEPATRGRGRTGGGAEKAG